MHTLSSLKTLHLKVKIITLLLKKNIGYVVFCPEHYEPVVYPEYSLLKEADEKLKFVKLHRNKDL